MKKLFKLARSHPLVSGSAIIFSGTLFANVFHFIFNLYMSRNLSVSEYGILASLVSIILLFALIADSFVPTIVHFSSVYFARNDLRMVSAIFLKVSKYAVLLGVFVFLLFIIFLPQIQSFFKISQSILITLASLTVSITFLSSLNRAVLQSMLSFKFIAFIGILGSFVKVLLGIILVGLGFKVAGAMWAFFIAFLLPYLVTFFPLRFIFSSRVKESNVELGDLIRYGAPATLSLLGLTFFITSDILLVKHFFNTEDAGIYAGLSLIGRVIYFFSAPIGLVMFPLIVQRHTRQEKYRNIFLLSIFLVFLASSVITLFYFFFPEFTIRLFLKKDEYLILKPLVWIFGLYISLYSIASIITNFFLSSKRTNVFIPILVSSCMQIILIWIFHNSFLQIISILIGCMLGLLIFYVIYYWSIYGRNKIS